MNVFIIAAVTVDGFIGLDSEHTADWTGTEDKKVFVRLTKEAGTIIMGSKTFATIGRALPGRRTIVMTHNPKAISAPDIETTSEAPAELLKRLEGEGTTAVAICGGASIYDIFLREGLVDELYITVVPQVFGSGLPLFTNWLPKTLSLLESGTLSDGCVLNHYKVSP
ncbi:dihydrofolate reductase [Candidatus Saccharibacteria bacterium]|nr:MAG: dihydrofolate reductase [Candidatus Saccharibacteria bacterium]